MGSDELCVLSDNCLCGTEGMFFVYCRRPDRGRRGAEYRGESRCSVCASKYRFIRQGSQINLVKQEDVMARVRLENKVVKYDRDLMRSLEVKKVFGVLQGLIESKGPVLERIKFLKSVKLWDLDHDVSCIASWIEKNMLVGDLEKVMKLVKIKDPVIIAKLKERQDLWEEATKSFLTVSGWSYLIKDCY